MDVKKQYKKTDLGILPIDWNQSKICEFSTPVRGSSPRPAGDPKYFNGNFIPWLTVAALTNIPTSEIYVSETESFLTEEGSHFSRTLESGTLIIANSGATLGVAKILSIKCCANDGIAALLDVSNDVDKKYLAYYINTLTRKLREVIATGNGQPNLNTELIGNIIIPLPSKKAEQSAISTVLSDADALISSLKRLIAKKRNIKQGAMQCLLQPKEGWKSKKMGEIADIIKGEQLNRETLSDKGTFPVYNGGMTPSGFTEKWNTEAGTIIISEGGNSCGFVNYINTRFWRGGHCYKIQTELERSFAYHLLKYLEKDIMALRVGSGLPNIQRTRLSDFILVYPKQDEQKRIAEILSDMDAAITTLETKLEKYRQIKQGMMQNLLTGKIRLV
jgi:type I restriction enzyme S subunit